MATILWTLGVAVALVTIFGVVRFWRRTAAPRLVTCPETGDPHAVEVDPAHRLTQKLRSADEMQLRDCSRWPERADCDQPCRDQIALAPDGCRVRSLLDEYYAHKSCVLCGKEFGEAIDWPARARVYQRGSPHRDLAGCPVGEAPGHHGGSPSPLLGLQGDRDRPAEAPGPDHGPTFTLNASRVALNPPGWPGARHSRPVFLVRGVPIRQYPR